MADDDICTGECDWRVYDDSYDDEFGTVRIAPYLECSSCPAKKAIE